MVKYFSQFTDSFKRFYNRRKKTPFKNIIFLSLFLGLFISNFYYPFISLNHYILKYIVIFLFLLVPYFLIANSFLFKRMIVKALSLTVSIPLSSLSTVLILFIIFEFVTSISPYQDVMFRKEFEIEMKHSKICIYSSSDINHQSQLHIRQEMVIFPYVSIVKEIYREKNYFYHTIHKVDSNTFRYKDIEYDIKDYVYF